MAGLRSDVAADRVADLVPVEVVDVDVRAVRGARPLQPEGAAIAELPLQPERELAVGVATLLDRRGAREGVLVAAEDERGCVVCRELGRERKLRVAPHAAEILALR